MFCSDAAGCFEPSPLTVIRDYCANLHDYGAVCLGAGIFVWEPRVGMQRTYTISNSRYVITSAIATDHSFSITEFGPLRRPVTVLGAEARRPRTR